LKCTQKISLCKVSFFLTFLHLHQIPWTSVHNFSTMYEKWYLFCDLFSVSPSLLKIHCREWRFCSIVFSTIRNFLMVGLTSFTRPCLLYVPGHLISKLCQWCILFLMNITLWYQIFSPWVCCEVIILLLLGNGILSCVCSIASSVILVTDGDWKSSFSYNIGWQYTLILLCYYIV